MTLAGRPPRAPAPGAPREQSRARYPDAQGHVERAGFTRFRRVAETPFNLVFEARP